jgi:hypothetical protein
MLEMQPMENNETISNSSQISDTKAFFKTFTGLENHYLQSHLEEILLQVSSPNVLGGSLKRLTFVFETTIKITRN